MNKLWTLLIIAGVFGLVPSARADVFKSVKECVPGKRVADKENKTGKVIRVSEGTLCMVLLDETGKEHAYIFWRLGQQRGDG